MDFDDQKHLCQLHQVFISGDMIEGLHADLSFSVEIWNEKVRALCQEDFIRAPCPPVCESEASERYTSGHGSVGEGRISMPNVWLLH
jgi:hypothetical protein